MDERMKRQFAIDLGALVIRTITDGLHPDEVLAVLKDKVSEEMSIQRTRKAIERTY